jgi:hypothetical protein
MDNDPKLEGQETAAQIGGDGMPLGNELTPRIAESQVETGPTPATPPAFDDDAAATIALKDYHEAQAWLDSNSWLAEWQYVDYLYQSPNYDRDWRGTSSRPARISRFIIAKNSNTMKTQMRRAIFSESYPFLLEPRGKLAGLKDDKTELLLKAWTELFDELSERAEFEYNMGLLMASQGLQGTGIGNPGWEEREVIRKTRKRKEPPKEVDMPIGGKKKIDTWESDTFTVKEEKVTESWPFFEYRRLGTTIFDPKWRTPNRPDQSAGYKIDIDYVNFEDLDQMREMSCYKDLPPTKDLKKYFLERPEGDAEVGSQVAQAMNSQSSVVLHAKGENVQTSAEPTLKPLMLVKRWRKERVCEVLVYESRQKVIRNEEHELGDHALGYTANWWDIDNCGYGIGIGRLNAGDQRINQGVLNEVLKWIGFPLNAPFLYDSGGGNAPTQNVIAGMGTFWGVRAPGGDVSKAIRPMEMPKLPPEAIQLYELAKSDSENVVGADSIAMQGNVNTPGSSAMRTATGVQRAGGKADENISDPVANLEGIIRRWLEFLWEMVLEQMPIREIREILSDRLGDAIVAQINAEDFLNAKFKIKILCGQKLAAKAAIMQLIPFILQIFQQPQLMQFLHQKGWTVNFKSIEDIMQRMSELNQWQDIFVPLTPEEKQMVQSMQPGAQKAQADAAVEQVKGQEKLKQIAAKGQADVQASVVDHALEKLSGADELALAEGRVERNTDMQELNQGVPGVGE